MMMDIHLCVLLDSQVLQTTDLPCLIVHIADTLQGALDNFDIIQRLMQDGRTPTF